MKSSRFSILSAVVVFAAIGTSPLKADEIEVLFSGVVTITTAPGVNVGDSFSGELIYSTDDPFEVLLGGQSEYSLLGPGNSESLSSGAYSVSLDPPAGIADNIFIDPGLGCVFAQAFAPVGAPAMSLQFCGNSDFLTSGALPDPFDASDVILGNVAFPSSNAGFTVDGYFVDGYVTQVSTVPEPRGSPFVFAFAVLAAVALRRRLMASRS